MRTSLFIEGGSPRFLTRALAAIVSTALVAFPLVPVMAQVPPLTPLPCFDATGNQVACEGLGGTRNNGTMTQPAYIRAQDRAAAGVPSNFFTPGTPPSFAVSAGFAGFKFEPESPYASLKSTPLWSELEQLLDNPYAFAVDTATPGNFDGWPSYGSTSTRRPS